MFGVLFGLLWRPELRIRTIHVTGTHQIAKDSVEAQIRSLLLGTRWLVVPADSLFFAEVDQMSNLLMQTHEWIDEIEISRALDGILTVSINEHDPAFVSCSDGACYYVSEVGFRFAPAPQFRRGPYIEVVGGTTTVRAYVIPPKQFASMAYMVDALVLPIEGDRISRVELTDDGDWIVYTLEGYEIRWNETDTRYGVIARLKATYESTVFKETLNASPDTLEYIDARFGNKVFYKFKENEQE